MVMDRVALPTEAFIVGPAQRGIAEDGVGFVDLLHAPPVERPVPCLVRMVLVGQGPIGGPDDLGRRVFGDVQLFVMRGHLKKGSRRAIRHKAPPAAIKN